MDYPPQPPIYIYICIILVCRWDEEIFRVIGMRLMNEIIIWSTRYRIHHYIILLLCSVTRTSGFTGFEYYYYTLFFFFIRPPPPAPPLHDYYTGRVLWRYYRAYLW